MLFSINDKEFETVKSLLHEQFGIFLHDRKKGLVTSRLQKILKKNDFSNFSEYIKYLKSDATGKALNSFVNNLTTNHTFFWREPEHFKFYQNSVLPFWKNTLSKQKSYDLRIWSAGCSSGEEPYMLEIINQEFFSKVYHSWDVGILATDISEKVLNIAKTGLYSGEKVKNLSKVKIKKYFIKKSDAYMINDSIKKHITFRRFNLMSNFPFQKKFHAILCKNVMIYFTPRVRKKLVDKFWNQLEYGGFFFIGLSESLGKATKFKYIKPSVYQKV